MKCLLEDLSDKEKSFQDCHSPHGNYDRRCLREGSNEPIRQSYFDNFIMSFQTNMMVTVVASTTDGCKNLMTKLRTHCNGMLSYMVSQMI